MKVGLIGFGKTGKAVATTLLRKSETVLEWVVRQSTRLEHRSVPEFLGEYSPEPGLIFSSQHTGIAELLDDNPVDIIIDFSSETGLEYYGAEAARRKVKILSAISHYPEDKLELLKKYSEHTAVFWSPNITLGINYLILSAKLLKKIAPYTDVVISEEHYKEKFDVSGTAKVIAHELGIEDSDIVSVRAGGIIGRHEIMFGFPYQTVRLIHESITREAFGNGAIFVAKELADKEAGLYTFEKLLLPYLTA
ncbi:MAG: dihydrodipicolinate reductase C-terminal domain-containing protein [candidate division FCPU426 bacterium]